MCEVNYLFKLIGRSIYVSCLDWLTFHISGFGHLQEQTWWEANGFAKDASIAAPERQVLGLTSQNVWQQGHQCAEAQKRTGKRGEALIKTPKILLYANAHQGCQNIVGRKKTLMVLLASNTLVTWTTHCFPIANNSIYCKNYMAIKILDSRMKNWFFGFE